MKALKNYKMADMITKQLTDSYRLSQTKLLRCDEGAIERSVDHFRRQITFKNEDGFMIVMNPYSVVGAIATSKRSYTRPGTMYPLDDLGHVLIDEPIGNIGNKQDLSKVFWADFGGSESRRGGDMLNRR